MVTENNHAASCDTFTTYGLYYILLGNIHY